MWVKFTFGFGELSGIFFFFFFLILYPVLVESTNVKPEDTEARL